MSENTSEELTPPKQETIASIRDITAALTANGQKLESFQIQNLTEADGHRVTLVFDNQTSKSTDPIRPLASIVFEGPEEDGRIGRYDVYKDIHSGKLALDKPPSKRIISEPLPNGDTLEEIQAYNQPVIDAILGDMEDTKIRRFRGIYTVDEPEAQELLSRLKTLST